MIFEIEPHNKYDQGQNSSSSFAVVIHNQIHVLEVAR